MKYDIILENWKKYLNEQDEQLSQIVKDTEDKLEQGLKKGTGELTLQQQKDAIVKTIEGSVGNTLRQASETAKKSGVSPTELQNKIIDLVRNLVKESKKNKSGDRCTRIAKRKYDVWPSAYASGAVVKCRQGKIWKGISEDMSDEEIDMALILESVEVIEEETLDEAKKPYKPNFSKEKEQGLHGWFARNDGKGWVNCRTGGPCGRESADSGGKYPACRPTKAQCKSAGKGPLRKKKSSEPISWTKNKKD